MSDSFLSDYLRTRSRVDQLERIESGGGGSAGAVYLTLTRTTTFTATTTGTVIVWEAEDRSNGITWSGSEITIPDDGYYVMNVVVSVTSFTSPAYEMLVNGVYVGRLAMYEAGSTRWPGIAMRYFTAGDVLEIRLLLGQNRTIQVVAYDSAGESPYLHIVKVA